MLDCIIYCNHIEYISDEHLYQINVIKNVDNTKTTNLTIDDNTQSSRICYKILLKNNSNNIAKCIYEKIGNTKNTDKELLVN